MSEKRIQLSLIERLYAATMGATMDAVMVATATVGYFLMNGVQ